MTALLTAPSPRPTLCECMGWWGSAPAWWRWRRGRARSRRR
ncbi:MAG: hypothetical protein VKO26_05175 [Cyanobacteriota bacterium]|nr:hypothetical protein [Cyanobacteriota bacterium]